MTKKWLRTSHSAEGKASCSGRSPGAEALQKDFLLHLGPDWYYEIGYRLMNGSGKV